jgi:hypothetical protein
LVGGGDIYDGQLFVPAVENRPRWRLIFSPPSGRLLLSITVKKIIHGIHLQLKRQHCSGPLGMDFSVATWDW